VLDKETVRFTMEYGQCKVRSEAEERVDRRECKRRGSKPDDSKPVDKINISSL